MMFRGSAGIALGLLLSCSRGEGPAQAELAASSVAELTAEELWKLHLRRNEAPAELSEAERAALARYDEILARFSSLTDATWTVPDANRPCIVTRDYELWLLPGSSSGERRLYTIKDHDGNVVADEIDETRMRTDFSYLHNLLHPEYMQIYDGVDYDGVDYRARSPAVR